MSTARFTDPDQLLPHVGCRSDGSPWTPLLVSLGFTSAQLLRSDAGSRYDVSQPQVGMKVMVAWLADILDRRDHAAWGLAELHLAHQRSEKDGFWPSHGWCGLNPQLCSLTDACQAFGDPAAVVGDEASFFVEQSDGRTLVFALRWIGDAKTSQALRSSMVTHLGGYVLKA